MIIRNYAGEDGKSHFEEIRFSFEAYAGVRERTALQGATGVRFARWPAGFFLDWHNAPRRQYVIILSGQVEIGSRRRPSCSRQVISPLRKTSPGKGTRLVSWVTNLCYMP